MKKVKFLYNPRSGDKSIVNKLDDIIEIYQSRNYIIEPFRLSQGSKIKNALTSIDEAYDHILVAGGDGTVDSVVNSMKKLKIDIPIGILPTGTANDFANMLNIPLDIESAVNQILNSKPKKIDLGKVNSSYFVNIASSGMFTDVSQKIDPILKNSLGRVSYILKGIEEAVNLKQFNVSIKSDEITYKGPMYLFLVFNGSTAGNINLAHSSKIDDGLLDVIVFKTMPAPKMVKVLRKLILGHPIDKIDDILYFKTNELFIDCLEKINTDIDGEKGPDFPLHITCESKSIDILGLTGLQLKSK